MYLQNFGRLPLRNFAKHRSKKNATCHPTDASSSSSSSSSSSLGGGSSKGVEANAPGISQDGTAPQPAPTEAEDRRSKGFFLEASRNEANPRKFNIYGPLKFGWNPKGNSSSNHWVSVPTLVSGRVDPPRKFNGWSQQKFGGLRWCFSNFPFGGVPFRLQPLVFGGVRLTSNAFLSTVFSSGCRSHKIYPWHCLLSPLSKPWKMALGYRWNK